MLEQKPVPLPVCPPQTGSGTRFFFFTQILYIKSQLVSHRELRPYYKDQPANAVY